MTTIAAAGLAIVFLLPEHACAQATTNFRKWDVDGSFEGLWRTSDSPDLDVWWSGYPGKWVPAFGAGIGRYWSRHLKGEASLMLATPLTSADFVQLSPAAVPPRGALYIIDTSLRITAAAVRATYQFRDNAFTHPYLSGGVRFLVLRERRVGEGTAYRGNEEFSVPAVDERATWMRARPFVAGGLKSYFNERVFVRTDLQVAFGSGVITDLTSRISFGADF